VVRPLPDVRSATHSVNLALPHAALTEIGIVSPDFHQILPLQTGASPVIRLPMMLLAARGL
jgi:hypothetical protein